MNTEQIRELAIRAGDDWDHTLESDKEFLKKFAQLIVRECLSYAKDGDIDFMKFMIKKHFGVEE
jgi:hypothetical protein